MTMSRARQIRAAFPSRKLFQMLTPVLLLTLLGVVYRLRWNVIARSEQKAASHLTARVPVTALAHHNPSHHVVTAQGSLSREENNTETAGEKPPSPQGNIDRAEVNVQAQQEHHAHSAEENVQTQQEHRAHSAEENVQTQQEHHAHSGEVNVQTQQEHRAHSAEVNVQTQQEHRAHSAEVNVQTQQEHRAHRAEENVQTQQEHNAHSAEVNVQTQQEHNAHSAEVNVQTQQEHRAHSAEENVQAQQEHNADSAIGKPLQDNSDRSEGNPSQQEGRDKHNATHAGHASQAAPATHRYIVYFCKSLCGGWADRLKGIVIAYVIANLTHRQFGIKIPDLPCPLTEFLVPAQVPWDVPDSLVSGGKMHYWMDSEKIYQQVPHLNFSQMITGRVALFMANLDYFDQIKKNTLYKPQLQWMQPLTNDQIFASIFHQLFRLGPRLEKALQPALTSARPSPSHRLLCAHVRFASNSEMLSDSVKRHTAEHGDTVLAFLQSLDPSSPLYNATTATTALPSAPATADLYRFFVTSDSNAYLDRAERALGRRFVRTGGEFVHIDRKGAKRGQQVCEGFTKVLVDQQLLSHCDVLVVSKSGLSRQAAYLRATDTGLYCILMSGQLRKCERRNLRKLYAVLG